MAKKWRDFEKLITRLEQAMAPLGAEIKSPDRIADKITGTLREVDASVRYQGASGPVLITIECRDRIKIEDVTWIEQISTKRLDIGANFTIAVSSNNFTKNAITKAEHYGIRTRTLRNLHAAEVIGLLTVEHIEVDDTSFDIVGLGVNLFDMSDGVEFSPEMIEFSRGLRIHASLFQTKYGRWLSINDLLDTWMKLNGSFFPEDIAPGESIRRNLAQTLERDTLYCETTKGLREIRLVRIDLLFSRTISQIPRERLVEYAGPQAALLQTAEFPVYPGAKLSMHRQVGSENYLFRVTNDADPSKSLTTGDL